METKVKVGSGSFLAGGAACLLLAIAGDGIRLAQAQQKDFSKIEVKVTPIAGKIFLLQGSGGNIAASVGEDGTLIVDDEYEPLAPKIRAALAGIGGGDKVKMVINTHWHGDHTGSNKIFGAEAPILAQTNVRKRMSVEQTVFGEKIPASPKVALPVVTFDQTISVHWNGEEIKVIHFPHGHTDGDSVIFFTGSNIVHMGDDFFNGSFPFVDLASGGSVSGLIENVGKLLTMIPADAKIIPGHGDLATHADLEHYHTVLVQTSDIIHRRMQAGESLEKMQAEGFPESFKSWGAGFVDNKLWIQILRDSLALDAKNAKNGGHPSVSAAPPAHR